MYVCILPTDSVSCVSELIHYSFGTELNVLTYCNVHVTKFVVSVSVWNDFLVKFAEKPNGTKISTNLLLIADEKHSVLWT